jgi:hypothetical protein
VGPEGLSNPGEISSYPINFVVKHRCIRLIAGARPGADEQHLKPFGFFLCSKVGIRGLRVTTF